ncbi:MAG: universal stress protein [Planctomycetota bacterium]
MSQFQSILMPLGLTDNDADAIRYAGFISRMVGVNTFYFVHVNNSLEIPKEILAEHPNLLPPLDEGLERDMKVLVERNFGENLSQMECSYKAMEGQLVAEVLRYASIKDVDLILSGTSREAERSSTITTSLARKASCPVLSVPYGHKPSIKTLGCPMDFSRHSERAFATALELANQGRARLVCIHAYDVPRNFAKARKSHEEFAAIMKAHAQHEFGKLMSTFHCDPSQVTCEYVLNGHPPAAIHEVLNRTGIDMLVIGSRGHGAVASMVLGSVAEEILLTAKIPVMAVKEKGDNASFLKLFFNEADIG